MRTVLLALVVVVLAFVYTAHAQTALARYLFTDAEAAQWNARCIDGSNAGFYYAAATSTASANKWAFFLEGGGFCLITTQAGWSNVENCNHRKGTAYGTSTKFPATQSRFDKAFQFAASWNQVYIPYCSGDLHSGQMTTAVDGKYQSGHLIINGIVQKLKNDYSFSSANEVFVSGGSAGGIGVYVNANWFKSQVSSTATVKAYTNCGWFQSSSLPPFDPTYVGDQFKLVYDQVSPYLDPLCTAANTARPWDCYAGNFVFPTLKTPLFVAQSIFDQNSLVEQSGVKSNPDNGWADPDSNQYIVGFGQASNNTLKQVYNCATCGIFATSKWEHEVAESTGYTMLNAWYAGVKTYPWKSMDSRTTPDGATLTLPSGTPAPTPAATTTKAATTKAATTIVSTTTKAATTKAGTTVAAGTTTKAATTKAATTKAATTKTATTKTATTKSSSTGTPTATAFLANVTVSGRPEAVDTTSYSSSLASLLKISAKRVSTQIVRRDPKTAPTVETFDIVSNVQQGTPAVTTDQISNLKTSSTFQAYLTSKNLVFVSLSVTPVYTGAAYSDSDSNSTEDSSSPSSSASGSETSDDSASPTAEPTNAPSDDTSKSGEASGDVTSAPTSAPTSDPSSSTSPSASASASPSSSPSSSSPAAISTTGVDGSTTSVISDNIIGAGNVLSISVLLVLASALVLAF